MYKIQISLFIITLYFDLDKNCYHQKMDQELEQFLNYFQRMHHLK